VLTTDWGVIRKPPGHQIQEGGMRDAPTGARKRRIWGGETGR